MSSLMEASERKADFPEIAQLLTSTRSFPSLTLVHAVADFFFGEPSVDAVAILKDDRPAGLVTRQKLLLQVFRRFGWEIYRHRTIEELMDSCPLSLAGDIHLDEALNLALTREQDDVYDDIVVTGPDGSFLGLLSVRQLVVQQSHSLANIMLQKNLAHERALALERLDQLKTQFLANVTHELRSPVNAIIEIAELIRIATERGYVEQMRDRLTLLLSSATNLRSLITNMLDLSKIEAGRMSVVVEEFDLASVLREVADTTRVLIGGKPVEIELLLERSSISLTNDSVKVRQIVTNLASNAARFTDHGRITIGLRQILDGVAIYVEDTGIGIAEQDLGRLFTAFTQLEDAKSKRHGGTGLGLAITRQLLDLVQGTIEIESTPGKGSRFTVLLPLRIEQPEEAQ